MMCYSFVIKLHKPTVNWGKNNTRIVEVTSYEGSQLLIRNYHGYINLFGCISQLSDASYTIDMLKYFTGNVYHRSIAEFPIFDRFRFYTFSRIEACKSHIFEQALIHYLKMQVYETCTLQSIDDAKKMITYLSI